MKEWSVGWVQWLAMSDLVPSALVSWVMAKEHTQRSMISFSSKFLEKEALARWDFADTCDMEEKEEKQIVLEEKKEWEEWKYLLEKWS